MGPGSNGFNFPDLLNQFTGNASTINDSHSGFDLQDIISQATNGAQQNQVQQPGTGGLMDLIKGFISNKFLPVAIGIIYLPAVLNFFKYGPFFACYRFMNALIAICEGMIWFSRLIIRGSSFSVNCQFFR